MTNFKTIETQALYIILGSKLTKQYWRKKRMIKKKRSFYMIMHHIKRSIDDTLNLFKVGVRSFTILTRILK